MSDTNAITPASGVSSRHPQFVEFLAEWEQMRDTHKGQRKVKEKGQAYLPATSGMIEDGLVTPKSKGALAYQAYLIRAVFPSFVTDAVQAALGVMHSKPPVIELPAALEPLRERATLMNENLEMLLQRINEEQLVTGRVGLLLDMPERLPPDAPQIPYVALYTAEHIINWDAGRRDGIELQNLNLVVLDETEYERQPNFEWKLVNKYRVLTLSDPNQPDPESDEGSVANVALGEGIYTVGVYREVDGNFNNDKQVTPAIRGTTMTEIPFTFINSKDIVPAPDSPPLLGLSDLCLTIYRGEADYRQALFMQGQDTLVIVGDKQEVEQTYRTGANASISLPTGGSAEYIGVDSTGLPEMRTALENDRSMAARKGGELMDSVSREAESGEALSIRVAARTATLRQIAISGAFGLEKMLKQAAVWAGANPEQVKVTPNLDFVDDTMTGKELIELVSAKNMGAPISMRSIHELMEKRGLTEMTLEEELEEIEAEEPMALGSDVQDPNNPDNPDDPNNPNNPDDPEEEDAPDDEDEPADE